MNMSVFTIQTEKFSGPLDLLLKVIEEKNLEITDINLSNITGEYLKYLESQEITPNDLADFLIVASTLLLIKSKAILPTLNLSNQEEEEIIDLKDRLTLYKNFKDKSLYLKDRILSKTYFFSHEPFLDTSIHFSPPEKLKIEDLQNAFLQVFEIYQQENIIYPSQKVKILVNLKERIQQILQKLTKGKKYNFNDLVDKNDKIDIIVSFLAILHLAKEGVVELNQDTNFSDIKLNAL